MGKAKIISSKNKEYIEKIITEHKQALGIKSSHVADYLAIIPPAGKKSLGIETVKELKSWCLLKPFAADNKLAVIFESEVLTPEAQNSMLKLLEEPQQFVYILLTTINYKLLLPTVISRCEVLEHNHPVLSKETALTFTDLDLQSRFAIVEDLLSIKDKQEQRRAVNLFLTDLTVENRKGLLYDIDKSIFLRRYELLKQTKEMLDRNVLIKLTLENLVINFDNNA